MRQASKTPNFPYGRPHSPVTYFTIRDGVPTQIHEVADLRRATLAAADDGPTIYAAWPGRYRTDLFEIDDPQLLWTAIALKGR